MKFSSMLLYVNDEFPTKLTFTKLQDIGRVLYRKGNFLYSVEQEFVKENYYWMYFQYDNESLYSDTVVDTSDNSEKSNPRPKNQVEMRYQLFACYDLEKHLLYLSDYNKKATVTDYISDMLQTTVMTKNVLKSIDEFVSAVKYLKSVTFTQRRTLYTDIPDSIFRKQANLFGLDLPEHSKLKLDYGFSPIGIVKTTLQNWGLKRDSGEFDDVIVVGIDDSGFENTFNFSTMIASIEFDLTRDENYRYNPESVRVLLLAKLGV
ncbi:MAG: hypothetical protein PHY23_03715 [Oscillospiraceae bacterium]|jgi:hypothetical protein|nr:hypothetical protein [Oscillospiraceae bacterium]